MSGHDRDARREAATVSVVLMGARGHTVPGYLPAAEDLSAAAPAQGHRAGQTVRGPHLRQLRRQHARSRSGIVGVYASIQPDGRGRRYVYAQIGGRTFRFNVATLGRAEAWRRALRLRAEHERAVVAANAAILAAREGGARS